MSIIGPSFMGKTQLAFTLSFHLKVIYVNLSTLSRNFEDFRTDQEIYRPFINISRIFDQLVKKDIEINDDPEFLFNAGNLIAEKKNLELYTIGLIFWLIKLPQTQPNIRSEDWMNFYSGIRGGLIEKLSVQDFNKRISGININ